MGAETTPAVCGVELHGFIGGIVLACQRAEGHDGPHKADTPRAFATWTTLPDGHEVHEAGTRW